MFLSETHCGKDRLEGLKAQLGMCGLFLVDSVGKGGEFGVFLAPRVWSYN